MRRTLLCSLVFVLGAGCSDGTKTNNDMGGGSRTLVLLHTNDEHSHVLGDSPELDDFPPPSVAGSGAIKGGIGRRAKIFKQERDAAAAAGADTLTVSAGDNEMGTLFGAAFTRSAPAYTLMKAIGYDVTTVGNHELDFGPKGLAAAIKAAQSGGGLPQIVASNIQFSGTAADADLQALMDESGTDTNKPLHRTWMVTTPNGLKVGFIGALGADASYSVPQKAPVTFSLPAGAKETEYAKVQAQAWIDLQKAADALRAAKADLVIVLSHSGVDTTDATKGEDYQIAQNVTGVDVIVSGHTHVQYPLQMVMNPTSGKPVFIQQANYFGYHVGKITLQVDAQGHVSVPDSKLIPVDDTIVASDATLDPLILNLVKDLESTKVMGPQSFLERTLSHIQGTPVMANPAMPGSLFFQSVGTLGFDLGGVTTRPVELPLHVLAADAELAAADRYVSGKTSDFSIVAAGVFRGDLLKGKTGKLGFSDLFRAVSLGLSTADGSVGYPLVRFAAYPAEVRAALELTTSFAYLNNNTSGFYLVAGGLRMEYDTSRPHSISRTLRARSTPPRGASPRSS